MTQRRAFFAAAAGLGLSAGAGAWLWRSRDQDGDAPAPPGFWAHSFATPAGGQLAMGSLAGRPLLLNFWATWCAPCVTEIPMLDRFAAARSKAWNVLALAVDSPDAVRRFLASASTPHLPVALAGDGAGLELARSLGGRGALPFSVVFSSAGRVVASHLGSLDDTLLQRWTAATV